jgi:hypothetical protein
VNNWDRYLINDEESFSALTTTPTTGDNNNNNKMQTLLMYYKYQPIEEEMKFLLQTMVNFIRE